MQRVPLGTPTRAVSQPSLAPPTTSEGSWISDGDSAGIPGAIAGDGSSYFDDTGAQCGDQGFGDFGDGSCADGSCGDGGCDPYGGAGGGPLCCRPIADLWAEVHAHRRTYVQVDYLSYWMQGNKVPPLVTTSPPGTLLPQAGVLPVSATTSILFGNDRLDTQQRSGGRITVGYWLVDGEFLGVEGQYFTFQPSGTRYRAESDFNADPNAPILARPFIDVGPGVVTPTENSQVLAYPGVSNVGSVEVNTTSYLQSANATLRKLLWIDFTTQRRLDLLLGYRFLRLDDSVTIDDTFQNDQFGVTFRGQDQFSARNWFNGGEIGLKGQCYCGRFSLEMIAKCAFGNNTEKVHINGFTTSTSGGQSSTVAGGLLTQPTNIGDYTRSVFAVLPEANINLRFDLARNWRAVLGYNYLYINRVQRSGSAINRELNPTQIGGNPLIGTPAPVFAFNDTPFWAHGANAGIEYRW